MSSNRNKGIWGAVGILAGGIIGAGVFSLPYVVHEVGLLAGLALLFLGGVGYCYLHLMYADVIIGTAGEHRFVGYIKRYLGAGASYLALLMAVVQMIFVLTIYLILSVSFVHLILPEASPLSAAALFWAVSSLTMFVKLKKLAAFEMFATVGIVGIIALLFAFGAPHLGSLAPTGEATLFVLLPLAAIFFALSGRVAIPPLVHYVRAAHPGREQPVLQRSIVVGTAMPAVVYGLFVLAVIALSGSAVSDDAVTGLVGALPQWFTLLVGLLGLLALWSSYILVGIDVYDTLRYDFDVPRWLELFLVVATPLVLYLLGFTSFIGLISFVGGIFLAAEGAFILLMWRAALARRAVGHLVRPSVFIRAFLWLMLAAALLGVLAGRG